MPQDNAHPWARRTCEEILEQVADPVARKYLKAVAHSDMATEPHLTNGLIGLRNFLKSVPGYGAQYSIARRHGDAPASAGREPAPHRTWSSTLRSCGCRGIATRATRSASCRARRVVQQDFDAVVVALPYNRAQDIEWAGERLRARWRRMSRTTIGPGHYLRISILFERPFWRRLIAGSWVMLDAFGGCCVYDEGTTHDAGAYGVLGWLVAGANALSLCNENDRTLIARALDSLPDELYDQACRHVIEGKVHRWAGAVSGHPGGFPVRDPCAAHQPEPVEHAGLVVVGDYLFDSTLNGVLRSAHIATGLVHDRLRERGWLSVGVVIRHRACPLLVRQSSPAELSPAHCRAHSSVLDNPPGAIIIGAQCHGGTCQDLRPVVSGPRGPTSDNARVAAVTADGAERRGLFMQKLEIDASTWAELNQLLDAALDQPPSHREQWIERLAPQYAGTQAALARSALARRAHQGQRLPQHTPEVRP